MTTVSRIIGRVAVLTCLATAGWADWAAVTEPAAVRALFADTVLRAELKPGVEAIARYHADGTGELAAWGEVFPRDWHVTDDGQVCILIDRRFQCFAIERDTTRPDTYRGTVIATGEAVVFTVEAQAVTTDTPRGTSAGGAAAPSAEELAAKLANPTAPVMTIGNNIDVVTFKGDLPGAGDEWAARYVFQTVFPYKLERGGSVFFRPAVPVLFNEPVPDGGGGFDSKGVELGDTGFDFSYGTTTAGGLLWGAGIAGTIPTATDDALGKKRWAVGPEVLLGVIRPWGVIGGLLSHQWDVAGSGDAEIDVTGLSYFYAFSLGDGWQIASGPSITYDHTRESGDRLTLPLGLGLAKTTVLKGRPWKFQLQYWYYAEAPDAFGPRHQIRLSVNPVIAAPWNEGR